MNKQQLASKIWESANKMRSKIEANVAKTYKKLMQNEHVSLMMQMKSSMMNSIKSYK